MQENNDILTSEKELDLIDGKKNATNMELQTENESVCEPDYTEELNKFIMLAKLMSINVSEVKDKCILEQIKFLTSRMAKVIVKYNVTDKELEKILSNSSVLGVNELFLSPAYIPAVVRQQRKNNCSNVDVSCVIDFPFGESLFKSKLSTIKDSVKLGVRKITVTMPSMLLEPKKIRQFKCQVKKLGKIKKVNTSICVSPLEISNEQLLTVLRTVEKTKIQSVVCSFGDVKFEELKDKLAFIQKNRGKKEIRVLFNASTPLEIFQAFDYSVDQVLTPFATEIGEKMVEEFEIKNVKIK